MLTHIEFVKAYAICRTHVEVVYKLDEIEFKIEWCNIDPETGEEGTFNLQDGCHDVQSICDDLAERVLTAIRLGETDENKDIDLYLYIRDTFTYDDCEEIANKEFPEC